MLMDEGDPMERSKLNVGAERGVNCEHVQVLVTEGLGMARGQEGQGNSRDGQAQCGIYVSLAVRTTFGVGKPSLVAQILTHAGRDDGHEGSAGSENCEARLRYTRCIRQGSVEAPVLWHTSCWCGTGKGRAGAFRMAVNETRVA